ncbi:DUF192 domain-containing protein [Thalassococcus lentus]
MGSRTSGQQGIKPSKLAATVLAATMALMACKTDAVADPACRDDTVHLRGDFGQARFTISIADSAEERNQGLMFVEKMAASAGMLFVYDSPREVSFWMKNTLIPLDIIFADEEGVVQNVQANAIPGDLTPLPGEGPIQYVLEINGGMAALLGIKKGTQLRHPAIENAVWACS